MKVFQATLLAAVAQAARTRDPDMDSTHFVEEIGAMDDYMSEDHFNYSGYYNDYGSYYGNDYGHHDHHVDHHGHGYHYDDHHYDDVHSDYHDSYSSHSEHYSDHHTEYHDSHSEDDHYTPEPVHYEHDEGDYAHGDVPTGDFWHQVDDFDEWEEIWSQEKYEERLETEASLMVALEALREDLVDLDHDIDDLYDCISDNDSGIDENDHGIHDNDHGIEQNDDEISDQEHRVERLQRQCRHCQEELDYDRDFLILHCQQFAFAPDMVGACADILTCSGTRLAYRADIFNPASHSH